MQRYRLIHHFQRAIVASTLPAALLFAGGCQNTPEATQAPTSEAGSEAKPVAPRTAIPGRTPIYIPPKGTPMVIPTVKAPVYIKPERSPVYIPYPEGEEPSAPLPTNPPQ